MEMQQRRFLYILGLVVSCPFIYGGAVNLGFSGPTFAIPFMISGFILSKKVGGHFQKGFYAFFGIGAALYGLKHFQTKVFFPALGEKIKASEDLCIYNADGKIFTRFPYDNKCGERPVSTLADDEYIKKGESFTIDRIKVSHADMGETYVVESETPYRNLYYSSYSDGEFLREDGTILRREDLRRGIFYEPSILMMYPILFIMALSIFK